MTIVVDVALRLTSGSGLVFLSERRLRQIIEEILLRRNDKRGVLLLQLHKLLLLEGLLQLLLLLRPSDVLHSLASHHGRQKRRVLKRITSAGS